MSERFFLSWVRLGAAAGIDAQDQLRGPMPAAPSITPHVVLARDGNRLAAAAKGPALRTLGPADVLGINPGLVIRLEPAGGSIGAQQNELAYIEFSRPDLPWMFTPAAPNQLKQRLRPWIVLVCVPESKIEAFGRGLLMDELTVAGRELPDLEDSWAWAHAQVMADGDGGIDQILSSGDPRASSRLLCPRGLFEQTTYRAAVVPAVKGAQLAGLGEALPQDPAVLHAPAWSIAENSVRLPVYYSWSFTTGPREDFEALARRLERIHPNEIRTLGGRTIDVTSPWPHRPSIVESAGEAGAGSPQTIELDGALRLERGERAGSLSQACRASFESRLAAQLNFPSTITVTTKPDPDLRSVGPPIYGARHVGVYRLPETPSWLLDLNLDIRRRIAASEGTRYVQDNQEFLMARAWEQLGDIEKANKLRRFAELAAVTAQRMHTRHVGTLGVAELVGVAAPARTRIRVDASETLERRVGASALPNGVATPAFNRVFRPAGPVARRLFDTARMDVVEKGLQGTVRMAPAVGNSRRLSVEGVATPRAAARDATLARAARYNEQLAAEDRTAVAFSVASAQRAIDLPASGSNPEALQRARTLLSGPLGQVAGAQELRTLPIRQLATRFADATDVLTAVQVGGAVRDYLRTAGEPSLPPSIVASRPLIGAVVQPQTFRSSIVEAMQPASRLALRLRDRVHVPPVFDGAEPFRPVMACPRFGVPLAMELVRRNPELLLPGLREFPLDRVVLLETNPAFIEALLVGVNHEMNREFLWREFPTDQRGTSFRHFWPRPGGTPDIGEIAAWSAAQRLGTHIAGGQGAQLVLLVRGTVLGRYRGTIVFAAPARFKQGSATELDIDDGQAVMPEFVVPISDDTTIYAFPSNRLSSATVHRQGNNLGWFFVFQEPVTVPRFGFDLPASDGGAPQAAAYETWNDLTWDRVPMDRAFATPRGAVETPANEQGAESPRWDRDAADTGRIAVQRPFRMGFHADTLLGA